MSVVFGRKPLGGTTAWSIDGDRHSHIEVDPSNAETRDGLVARRPIFDRALDEASPESIRAATIAVEDMEGDILFVTGRDDTSLPAERVAELAIDRLETTDFAYDFEHRTYSEAGHLISWPYRPTAADLDGGGKRYGGTPAGLARANADSWPRIVDHLSDVGGSN